MRKRQSKHERTQIYTCTMIILTTTIIIIIKIIIIINIIIIIIIIIIIKMIINSMITSKNCATVRVKVATKHAAIEALQTNHHAIGLLAIAEPRRDP